MGGRRQVDTFDHDQMLLEDFREVMQTKAGRAVVWDILDRAKIFQRCYTGNSDTYYNEGRRELGLFYFNLAAGHFPAEWHKAQQEAQRRKRDG